VELVKAEVRGVRSVRALEALGAMASGDGAARGSETQSGYIALV